MLRKLFKLNEDGVAEWVIAKSKYQAIEFIKTIWGGDTVDEYYKEYLEDVPGATFDQFVDSFVIEEPEDENVTIIMENGDRITKTIREWLKGTEECPSYLCCQDW